MPDLPTFPVPTLTVRPWADAVIDELGHDPRSPYVERFWLGVLGPSATWFVRRLASGLEASPGGFELDTNAMAGELGLGTRGGKHSPFVRTVDRCCRFGVAELVSPGTLRVRRKLPPLTRAQLARLPGQLQDEHGAWVARPEPGSATAFEELRQRARRLALSLLELGEDGEGTERQLHRWRVHPAMAHEATAWAVARHRGRAPQVSAEVEVNEGPVGAA
jgi:hypothetical protein